MTVRALALISIMIFGACAETGGDDPGPTYTDHVHVMPLRDPGLNTAAPVGAHLTYYGGKVIQHVDVVQVLYGSGTYIPQLTATSGQTVASFYAQGVTSGVWDWLAEYDTTSPPQTIGRGTFGGAHAITPDATRDGATITDANIQAELAAQIASGSLPPPDDNSIYMFHFPAGKTITTGTLQSCVAGGFCAYHGTFQIGAQNVYYGVMPDLNAGICSTGCGGSTIFNNQTSVASHELIEATTDAEVGLATSIGPPIAWYDSTNGEIGDICNGQQGTFAGNDGFTYTIQQEFSNQQNACITTRAVTPPPDFAVSESPASVTIAPGGTAAFAVSTAAISGSTQTVTFSVTGLPSGVTGVFSPSSVTAGGSATLTLSASTSATGNAMIAITGTSGATSHSAAATVTVAASGVTTLVSGVPVTGIAGATGSQALYAIVVPSGKTKLTVTISGSTGNADLYVRRGAAPTLSTYDCRPYLSGDAETCTIAYPSSGTWYVMLNGRSAYTGVTLTATYTTAVPPLTNNVAVTSLSGATGSSKYWKLAVPAGQTQVVFQISGGTGNADLYVRKSYKPTGPTYDCRPYLAGNAETCTIASPASGVYYVMVRARAAYSGLTLIGHYP